MNNNRPSNNAFFNNIKESATYINKVYDKTTFSDNYGSSIVICILVTLFVLFVFLYCLTMQKKQEIYADWNNNRCKPQYIPVAGFIAAPEGQSISSYTSENFQYCLNSQAIASTGYLVQPIAYMLSSLTAIVAFIMEAINALRNMLAKFRDNVAELVKQVMGKLLNITTPIIAIFIAFLDSLKKTQGVMATGIFTLLSAYYALQALIGSILEMMGAMLTVMVIIIAICWSIPFTWGVAASLSAVYIVIAIILIILITTFVIMFNILPVKVPKLKCFDKNVQIIMSNGMSKNIIDIKAGDILENGVKVTAKMKLDAADLRMFNIKGIIVSETHIVKYGSKWLPIRDHPEAVEIFGYNEPYLYCLNTNSKEIILNGLVFTDWDEIYDDTLEQVINATPTNIFEKDLMKQRMNIHRHLDVGFTEDITIDLIDNTNKKIKDINIGDILLSGAKVYGIVEIETSELLGLGNNSFGNLYHLLTTDNLFSSNNQIIPDYNNHIDKLLKIKKII